MDRVAQPIGHGMLAVVGLRVLAVIPARPAVVAFARAAVPASLPQSSVAASPALAALADLAVVPDFAVLPAVGALPAVAALPLNSGPASLPCLQPLVWVPPLRWPASRHAPTQLLRSHVPRRVLAVRPPLGCPRCLCRPSSAVLRARANRVGGRIPAVTRPPWFASNTTAALMGWLLVWCSGSVGRGLGVGGASVTR
jgi:hypothetical protein